MESVVTYWSTPWDGGIMERCGEPRNALHNYERFPHEWNRSPPASIPAEAHCLTPGEWIVLPHQPDESPKDETAT